jgi:hypothetical protein
MMAPLMENVAGTLPVVEADAPTLIGERLADPVSVSPVFPTSGLCRLCRLDEVDGDGVISPGTAPAYDIHHVTRFAYIGASFLD